MPGTRGPCPVFAWCDFPHRDEWWDDENGDPSRAHTLALPPATDGPMEEPYLVVDETRTEQGTRFSTARITGVDGDMTVEEFFAALELALAQVPRWRQIAADVELLAAVQESVR